MDFGSAHAVEGTLAYCRTGAWQSALASGNAARAAAWREQQAVRAQLLDLRSMTVQFTPLEVHHGPVRRSTLPRSQSPAGKTAAVAEPGAAPPTATADTGDEGSPAKPPQLDTAFQDDGAAGARLGAQQAVTALSSASPSGGSAPTTASSSSPLSTSPRKALGAGSVVDGTDADTSASASVGSSLPAQAAAAGAWPPAATTTTTTMPTGPLSPTAARGGSGLLSSVLRRSTLSHLPRVEEMPDGSIVPVAGGEEGGTGTAANTSSGGGSAGTRGVASRPGSGTLAAQQRRASALPTLAGGHRTGGGPIDATAADAAGGGALMRVGLVTADGSTLFGAATTGAAGGLSGRPPLERSVSADAASERTGGQPQTSTTARADASGGDDQQDASSVAAIGVPSGVTSVTGSVHARGRRNSGASSTGRTSVGTGAAGGGGGALLALKIFLPTKHVVRLKLSDRTTVADVIAEVLRIVRNAGTAAAAASGESGTGEWSGGGGGIVSGRLPLPSLIGDARCYELRLHDEDGEADEDLPPLDKTRRMRNFTGGAGGASAAGSARSSRVMRRSGGDGPGEPGGDGSGGAADAPGSGIVHEYVLRGVPSALAAYAASGAAPPLLPVHRRHSGGPGHLDAMSTGGGSVAAGSEAASVARGADGAAQGPGGVASVGIAGGGGGGSGRSSIIAGPQWVGTAGPAGADAARPPAGGAGSPHAVKRGSGMMSIGPMTPTAAGGTVYPAAAGIATPQQLHSKHTSPVVRGTTPGTPLMTTGAGLPRPSFTAASGDGAPMPTFDLSSGADATSAAATASTVSAYTGPYLRVVVAPNGPPQSLAEASRDPIVIMVPIGQTPPAAAAAATSSGSSGASASGLGMRVQDCVEYVGRRCRLPIFHERFVLRVLSGADQARLGLHSPELPPQARLLPLELETVELCKKMYADSPSIRKRPSTQTPVAATTAAVAAAAEAGSTVSAPIASATTAQIGTVLQRKPSVGTSLMSSPTGPTGHAGPPGPPPPIMSARQLLQLRQQQAAAEGGRYGGGDHGVDAGASGVDGADDGDGMGSASGLGDPAATTSFAAVRAFAKSAAAAVGLGGSGTGATGGAGGGGGAAGATGGAGTSSGTIPARPTVTPAIGPDGAMMHNAITASEFQEWTVIKVNRRGRRQERVMGMDLTRVTNRKIEKRRLMAADAPTRAERLITDIRRVEVPASAPQSFTITFKETDTEDVALQYETRTPGERDEIIAKLSYLMRMNGEGHRVVHVA